MPNTNVVLHRRSWKALVHRALHPASSISVDQLLLVRDLQDQIVRPLEPPPGVIARPGAVLILLYPQDDDLCFPLTVRSDRLANHRGEVSLPGGATDPEDDGPAATALRECQEELGVESASIQVWGTLTSIYIQPSNFCITPVIGFAEQPPLLYPNSDEVSAVLTVTLRDLLNPSLVAVEQWHLRGREVRVPFFAIAGYKVWGATALILSELVARLRKAMTVPPSPDAFVDL